MDQITPEKVVEIEKYLNMVSKAIEAKVRRRDQKELEISKEEKILF